MELIQDRDNVWRIPKTGGMLVDGIIFASKALMVKAKEDRAIEQVANVAHLPGIVGHSLAMPDIHWGYGFPIGGVAATEVAAGGVVSPGGVGFDIGCGVRLLGSGLDEADLAGKLKELVGVLARAVPAGVGGRGLVPVDRAQSEKVLKEGGRWALAQRIGNEEDAEYTEDRGTLLDADPRSVSDKAIERGSGQLGSLGAGNHFLEVQVVDEIFDETAAGAFGLHPGQVCVMIHTGSRGLGHQVCTEEVRSIDSAMRKKGIQVPDRQLACVPVRDAEGQRYMEAMSAAANFARTNRHVLADAVRKTFVEVFGSSQDAQISTVYDVSHNVAKIESYEIEGKSRELCVHRKGATRSFGPGSPELPERYREVGQPVLIPGSMGTSSWVAVGSNDSAQLSFGSTCHGAGRMMSRKAAGKQSSGREVEAELRHRGILVRAKQIRLLAEEAPYAYKDVDEVIEVCHDLGLSKKVAKLRPVAVVKG